MVFGVHLLRERDLHLARWICAQPESRGLILTRALVDATRERES